MPIIGRRFEQIRVKARYIDIGIYERPYFITQINRDFPFEWEKTKLEVMTTVFFS